MSAFASIKHERKILWTLFFVATAILILRLYRLRYFYIDNDEAESISIGWLITTGKLIYRDIFTHHQPINYMATQLVAKMSSYNDIAKMRILPLFYFLLCAVTFICSPVKIDFYKKLLAATLFLILTAILCPVWYGWLALVDNLWAAFFVCFFNVLILPLLFADIDRNTENGIFFISGILLSLWLSGSLIAVYPFIIFSFAVIPFLKLNGVNTRRSLTFVFFGFLLPVIFQVCWLYIYGDLKDYLDQAILFNLNIYSEFSNYTGSNIIERLFSLTKEVGLKSFLQIENNNNKIKAGFLFFEVIALIVFSKYLIQSRKVSKIRVISSFIFCYMLFQSLAIRNFPFHSAPYCLTLIAFFSWSCVMLIGILNENKRYIGNTTIFIIIIIAMLIAKNHSIPTLDGVKSTWSANNSNMIEGMGDLYLTVDYIKKNTSYNDTIAALPDFPILYFETNRQPALGAAYYWPWQSEWEKSNNRTTACDEIKHNRPKFIWAEDITVWNRYPFHDYAKCIWSFINENYVLVGALYPNLYVDKVHK